MKRLLAGMALAVGLALPAVFPPAASATSPYGCKTSGAEHVCYQIVGTRNLVNYFHGTAGNSGYGPLTVTMHLAGEGYAFNWTATVPAMSSRGWQWNIGHTVPYGPYCATYSAYGYYPQTICYSVE